MQNPLIVGLYEFRSSHLLNSPLTSCNIIKFNDMPSPRKMNGLILLILWRPSLLQLRLLDRDHVIRLLLTPCGICHFNLTLSFLFLCHFLLHLFFFPPLPPLSFLLPPSPPSSPLFLPFPPPLSPLLPFLLLFLFLPFGVPARQGE